MNRKLLLHYGALLETPGWIPGEVDEMLPFASLLSSLSRPRSVIVAGVGDGSWYAAYSDWPRAPGEAPLRIGVGEPSARFKEYAEMRGWTGNILPADGAQDTLERLFPDGVDLLHLDLTDEVTRSHPPSSWSQLLGPASVVVIRGMEALEGPAKGSWDKFVAPLRPWNVPSSPGLLIAASPQSPEPLDALLSESINVKNELQALSKLAASALADGSLRGSTTESFYRFFRKHLSAKARIRAKVMMMGAKALPRNTRRGKAIRLLIRLRHRFVREIWRRLLAKRLRVPTFGTDGSLERAVPAGEPQVSVVIPVAGQLKLTKRCIETLFARTSIPLEVIIVDNGSDDETVRGLRDLERRYPEIRLLRNPKNEGFGRAVNQGAALAKAPFLLVSNNDVEFTTGSVESLLSFARTHPDTAVVSPMTNYVGEDSQRETEPPGITRSRAEAHATKIREREPQAIYAVDRLVFFCVLVRKDVWEELGGLSHSYGKGNFEDDDFCMRAVLSGHRLAVVRQAFVYHHGSRSWKGRSQYQYWFGRNRRIFYESLAEYALKPPPARSFGLPEISVIVRTKDRPGYLTECLLSLANQTFARFEVIVVNDGGEPVGEVLEQFANRLSVSLVSHPTSRGRAAALNSGLDRARGKWISYLDDDDIVYPVHLELLHSARERAPVVYALTNQVLIHVEDEGSRRLSNRSYNEFEFDHDELMVQNHIPIMSLLHEKSCLDTIGAFDPTLDVLEDYDFILRLALRFRFANVSRHTSEYRFRISDQSLNSITRDRREAFLTQIKIYSRYPIQDPHVIRRRLDFLSSFSHHIETLAQIPDDLTDADSAMRTVLAVLNMKPSDIGSDQGDLAVGTVP